MADSAALLYLLQVGSSSFPTGAFSHSLGFETLIAEGEVSDAATLEDRAHLWLRFGLAPLDGAAVALARDAALAEDDEFLARLDETLDTLKLARESHEASVKTGDALLRAAAAAFEGPATSRYQDAVAAGVCQGHAATAFGVAVADAGISAPDAVIAFLASSFSNLIGVAARLIPLGQLDVQRIIAHAQESLTACAALAVSRELDDMASSTAFLDLASMRHERLYTRLCIS